MILVDSMKRKLYLYLCDDQKDFALIKDIKIVQWQIHFL